MLTTDILIVGGGIIGLSIAREFYTRRQDLRITVLEKERSLARHASGRNSGVLHAGFYYTPDSLKARFTAEGNRLLTEYCIKHRLPINRCGKVVVARDENETRRLCELERRGIAHGIDLEMIDEKRLAELEPNAKTFDRALYSPTTAVVNPREVTEHIASTLQEKIQILLDEGFVKVADAFTVSTTKQKIRFNHLVNAAGLYADNIAHQFGLGLKYTLIPFKGIYLEYKDSNFIRRHIYPVPNLKNPFLGVHFTKAVDGKVKVGPTAIPAFWRENYHGFSHLRIQEFFDIVSNEAKLFFSNAGSFRDLAIEEMRKYSKKYFIEQSAYLVKKLERAQFGDYLATGIRAQLLDRKTMELVMDFVVERGDNSTHVLNAVSPAFTSAFSFSKFIVDEVEKVIEI